MAAFAPDVEAVALTMNPRSFWQYLTLLLASLLLFLPPMAAAPNRWMDFGVHMKLAEAMPAQKTAASHVLFHAAYRLVREAAPQLDKPPAATIAIMIFVLPLPLILFWLLKRAAAGSIPDWLTGALALSLTIVSPITFGAKFTMEGFINPTLYPSPTFLALRLFVVPVSLLALRVSDGKGPDNRNQRLWFLLFTMSLVLMSTLAKPSYSLALLPGCCLYALYRRWQRHAVDWALLTLGICLPGMLIIGLQFLLTFVNIDDGSSVAFGFLGYQQSLMAGWRLPFMFLQSFIFPLVALWLYRREARRDLYLMFSWLIFGVSVFIAYMFYEEGHRLRHANMMTTKPSRAIRPDVRVAGVSAAAACERRAHGHRRAERHGLAAVAARLALRSGVRGTCAGGHRLLLAVHGRLVGKVLRTGRVLQAGANAGQWRVYVILLLASALIFTPIMRVATSRSRDFRDHIRFAEKLPATTSAASHVLFHATYRAIQAVAPDDTAKSRIALLAILLYMLPLPLMTHWLLRREAGGAFPDWLTAALALCLTVMAPIALEADSDMTGYINPILYHNPTTMALRLFVVPLSLLSLRIFEVRDYASLNQRVWLILLAASLTMLSTLAKQSYSMALIPGLGAMALVFALRRKPVDWRLLVFGFCLPGLSLLALQFLLSYYGFADGSSIAPGFLTYLRLKLPDWQIALRFLLSLAFPLGVCLLHRGAARQDRYLTLCWVVFGVSLILGYGFYEDGPRAWHGNLMWSSYSAGFALMYASLALVLRQHGIEGRLGERRGWFGGRLSRATAIALLLLLLHTLSGLAYYWRFMQIW